MFHCDEVTIGWFGKERVDWMSLSRDSEVACYEIKVTKSDFYSNAAKTFIGHKNYYVLTKELYELVKDDIPAHIGVYVPDDKTHRYYQRLKCVKKAKKQELTLPIDDLKLYFIRSLDREKTKYKEITVRKVQEKLDKLKSI